MSPVACSLIKGSPPSLWITAEATISGAWHLSQLSFSTKVLPNGYALFSSPGHLEKPQAHPTWELRDHEVGKSDSFLFPHVFLSLKNLVQITTEFYSPKGAKANQLHNRNNNQKSLLQQNVERASAVAPSRQLSTRG